MFFKVYTYLRFKKKKSIGRFTKRINIYTSQIIQQIFVLHMKPKQDILILREHDNISDNFGLHIKRKFISEK